MKAFQLDWLHIVLFIALIGVTTNLVLQFEDKAEYKPNAKAMQEACQKNPQLLVCNMNKEAQ